MIIYFNKLKIIKKNILQTILSLFEKLPLNFNFTRIILLSFMEQTDRLGIYYLAKSGTFLFQEAKKKKNKKKIWIFITFILRSWYKTLLSITIGN